MPCFFHLPAPGAAPCRSCLRCPGLPAPAPVPVVSALPRALVPALCCAVASPRPASAGFAGFPAL